MPSIQRKPSDPTTPAPSAGGAAGTDHLSHLPKMSPTAGVGTEDYVAINVAAVFALLLGFAGILAVMETPFVILALAGIVVAIVAMRQINGSNGTQSGDAIALAGLFLAVGVTSFVAAGDVFESVGRSHDRAAIKQVTEQFGSDLHDGQYDAGYDLFSQHFKARVSRKEFVEKMRNMQDQLKYLSSNGQGLGIVNGAKWNGLATFYTEADSGTVTAQTFILFTYEHSENPEDLEAWFRKVGDDWTIDNIPSLFQPAR